MLFDEHTSHTQSHMVNFIDTVILGHLPGITPSYEAILCNTPAGEMTCPVMALYLLIFGPKESPPSRKDMANNYIGACTPGLYSPVRAFEDACLIWRLVYCYRHISMHSALCTGWAPSLNAVRHLMPLALCTFCHFLSFCHGP